MTPDDLRRRWRELQDQRDEAVRALAEVQPLLKRVQSDMTALRGFLRLHEQLGSPPWPRQIPWAEAEARTVALACFVGELGAEVDPSNITLGTLALARACHQFSTITRTEKELKP